MRPYLEKTHHKKGLAGGVIQGLGPEFKPLFWQKKIIKNKQNKKTVAKKKQLLKLSITHKMPYIQNFCYSIVYITQFWGTI
jgi:hypothetical protein